MELYNDLPFEVRKLRPKYVLLGCAFYYKIYSKTGDEVLISDDYYETEQEARFAAIGHISLLQKGDLK